MQNGFESFIKINFVARHLASSSTRSSMWYSQHNNQDRPRPIIVGVTGAQGVGKSTFCENLRAHLSGLGNGPVTLLSGLGQSIRDLGIPVGSDSGADSIAAVYTAHLRRERQIGLGVTILDRCIVDALAYVRVLGKTTPILNALYQEISARQALELSLKGLVNWLEIGVGDGENLRYLVQNLSGDRTFNVVAIDPELSGVDRDFENLDISLVKSKIEDFRIKNGHFQCVNIRQSIYYIDSPISTIRDLMDGLDINGVVAVTLWSEGCFLYKLHCYLSYRFSSDSVSVLQAEVLINAIPEFGRELLPSQFFEAPINIANIYQNEDLAEAFLTLVSRKLFLPNSVRVEAKSIIREFLHEVKPLPIRRNAIVLIGRRQATQRLTCSIT